MAAADELAKTVAEPPTAAPAQVEPLVEAAPPPGAAMLSDLHDVVYRLRAFMESEEGDFGLGVETGMQRAADMIENLLQRHTEQGRFGRG